MKEINVYSYTYFFCAKMKTVFDAHNPKKIKIKKVCGSNEKFNL